MVQWLRLQAANVGGLCLIPDWGTRFSMPQLGVCMPQLKRFHMPQLKNPYYATKIEDPTCCKEDSEETNKKILKQNKIDKQQ